MNTITKGLIAGAAGTSALNIATYLDMAVRGRPASSTPEETVERLAGDAHVDLGEGQQAEARKEGVGTLLGYATGLASAVGYGVLARRQAPWPVGVLALTALAMTGSNAPMTVLGVTDPRTWPVSSWLSDAIPHLAYGAAAYLAYEHLR
ncbi:hypothetical protein BTM25_13990 [Actinomadura rubteroloni]|uniref:DUF1440 domain-containing protein n=1 Tax=Actinomadura rubteroloni TaxID=1926885 RepID=A0A2P4UPL1_9ACTN|nr:hypothetical protein [Actinomadura rubteroloni]POM26991.1 hypothetical protein BTM25_13990 [Actinomadura rubteroloni]